MRLIDVDELIKTVNEDPFVLDGVKCYVRISAIKQPMIDAVEVIRCRDCKWFGDVGCAIMIADDSDKPTENDYCSFGERGDPDDE